MCCHTRKDRIWNDITQEKIDVTSIEKKDGKKSVKIVWACTKKVIRSVNQKSRLHEFQLEEKEKRETKKDVRGNHQKDLGLNNIVETLISNRAE